MFHGPWPVRQGSPPGLCCAAPPLAGQHITKRRAAGAVAVAREADGVQVLYSQILGYVNPFGAVDDPGRGPRADEVSAQPEGGPGLLPPSKRRQQEQREQCDGHVRLRLVEWRERGK